MQHKGARLVMDVGWTAAFNDDKELATSNRAFGLSLVLLSISGVTRHNSNSQSSHYRTQFYVLPSFSADALAVRSRGSLQS
jgi:hypothetical protein